MRTTLLAVVTLSCALCGGCTEDWDFEFGDPPALACGSGECDALSEVCCLDESGENPMCRASCTAPELTVSCSHPAHCPGEECCASESNFDGAMCKASCAAEDFVVCPGTENTCEDGATCAPNASGEGVFLCIE